MATNDPIALDLGDGIFIPETFVFKYSADKSPVQITKDEYKYFKRKKIIKGLYEKGKLKLDIPDRPHDFNEDSGIPDDLVQFKDGKIIKVGVKANLPDDESDSSKEDETKESTEVNPEAIVAKEVTEEPFEKEVVQTKEEIVKESQVADELLSNTESEELKSDKDEALTVEINPETLVAEEKVQTVNIKESIPQQVEKVEQPKRKRKYVTKNTPGAMTIMDIMALMEELTVNERRVLTEVMKKTSEGKEEKVKITRRDFEFNQRISPTKLVPSKEALEEKGYISISPDNWREEKRKPHLYSLKIKIIK